MNRKGSVKDHVYALLMDFHWAMRDSNTSAVEKSLSDITDIVDRGKLEALLSSRNAVLPNLPPKPRKPLLRRR